MKRERISPAEMAAWLRRMAENEPDGTFRNRLTDLAHHYEWLVRDRESREEPTGPRRRPAEGRFWRSWRHGHPPTMEIGRDPIRRSAILLLDAVGLGERLRRMRTAAQVPPCPYNSATLHYDGRVGLFRFRGTWREIGRQIAEAVPPVGPVEQARRHLEGLPAAARKRLLGAIDAALLTLEAHIPAARQMLDGLVDASAGVLPVVALANLSPQLADWRTYARSCSAVAFCTADGPVLGQNLDLGATDATSVALLQPDDGPAVLSHFSPGVVWFTTGVNSAGLVVGGASVNVARDFAVRPELLCDCLTDLMLLTRATTVAEAADLLRRMPGSGPPNSGIATVLCDRAGRIVTAEYTGSDLAVADAEVAIVANRFRSAALSPLNRGGDGVSDVLANSDARIASAETWAAAAPPSTARLRRLLRSRTGTGAWCRSAVPPDIGWTSASYCIDLARGTMDCWNGIAPHRPPRRTLELAALFGAEFG